MECHEEGLPEQTEVGLQLNPRREALGCSISGSTGRIDVRRGARSEGGAITGEGVVPADEDGLEQARARRMACEVKACVEMMSGAVWVRDRLAAAGWEVQVAHARKVRDVAPLACKTDKVDARVLAELCRRDLVPELWMPSLEDRALRERLRRRTHLVRLRASAKNRIFGLLTQWGAAAVAQAACARRTRWSCSRRAAWRRPGGARSPRHWQSSICSTSGSRRWTRSCGRSRPSIRACVVAHDPRHRRVAGADFAAEIGDVARFGSPRKLIGYAGLAPRVSQSGDRSRTGALSKAGSRTLRWAAVEAAHQSWRPSNPWHELYTQLAARHGKNPAKSAVARKVLIAAWHVLSRDQPFKPSPLARRHDCLGKLPLLSGRLTAPHGIEKPRQLPRTICAASAEREMSRHSDLDLSRPPPRA